VKKIFAIFAAVIIAWIMMSISALLKILLDDSRANIENIGVIQDIMMTLAPIIPLAIGVWLIKASWKKITIKKEN